jgi:hypothetical protein
LLFVLSWIILKSQPSTLIPLIWLRLALFI